MSDIESRIDGSVGHVTLNRPKAMNALNHQMVLDLEQAMVAWENDDAVSMLLIDAAGERAFCAGGDIVGLYNDGVKGDDAQAKQFWLDEYRVNHAISTYSKPYIAIMDGIVMGGGVGVSAHGSHRIVTERTMFAMPECGIGLLPDVGGTHLLSQTPGHIGEYAGLTGARLSGADCIYAGLADYFVASEDLPKLKEALLASGDASVIDDFISTPGPSELEKHQSDIDQLFNAASISNDNSEFAQTALKSINRGAPLSLLSTLKTVRDARAQADLGLALRNEYRFVSASILDGEFLEGIRAALVDKDRNPQWKYKTLAEVPETLIQQLDTPVTDGDFVAPTR